MAEKTENKIKESTVMWIYGIAMVLVVIITILTT